MQVIELRNYVLQPGRRDDFIRHFEEQFLESQRDTGMHVLGQFAIVDQPDRFLWIRGFADMAARRRGLDNFYDGAFWQARRAATNAMLVDHEDVHLLRPLDAIQRLTNSLSLDDRASEPPGVTAPDTGLVLADFYRAAGRLDHLVQAFESGLRPALLERGHQLLGHFVAERAPNDYPRLKVIQDPTLLVVLTAYRDSAHLARLTAEWDPRAQLKPLSTGDVVTLRLQPTARSIVRYRT
jgi:quinol monooxygenase YgiN